MIVAVVLGGLGLTLLALGWWGRRAADRIGFLPGLPDQQQRRRIAVIRRGGTTCVAVGVTFVIMAIGAAVY
ncbi:MAG: hypothetical protein J2P19_09120 [Pseudonocardia sp.]|nr:hypothetical protein [Pseudonocardia sp.]